MAHPVELLPAHEDVAVTSYADFITSFDEFTATEEQMAELHAQEVKKVDDLLMEHGPVVLDRMMIVSGVVASFLPPIFRHTVPEDRIIQEAGRIFLACTEIQDPSNIDAMVKKVGRRFQLNLLMHDQVNYGNFVAFDNANRLLGAAVRASYNAYSEVKSMSEHGELPANISNFMEAKKQV